MTYGIVPELSFLKGTVILDEAVHRIINQLSVLVCVTEGHFLHSQIYYCSSSNVTEDLVQHNLPYSPTTS